MASLYAINKEIYDLLSGAELVNEDGEILDDELYERFQALEMAKEEKRENIGLFIKNVTAENNAIANEIANLKERMQANTKSIERCENMLKADLDGQKWSTPKVAVSFRKSISTDIYNEADIPARYRKIEVKEVEKIDKKQIGADLKQAEKEGIELNIPGARLQHNLTVKVV